MGLGKKWFLWSQVVIGMLLVQAFATGMQILSRIILVEGTFVFALMTYRHLVAALCVAPLAFYFERVSEVNKCNKNVWFWLFCNALAGITGAMGLFYYGLRNTTATYATNFLNLVPIVTFVLSILLKLERLNLHTKEGKVKCIGALMCVSGALITSLYKGKSYYIISHHHTTNHSHTIPHTTHTNWPLGTLMLVGSCFSCSAWFLIQGILATAVNLCLLSWAISVQGPTYPPMFNPLALIFVAFLEALTLGEPITVGTLIGVVLIIFGLYSFLWGKRKEMQRVEGEAANSSANHELN
ncbi:hypothetical protein F8388_006340 [Cannabis sativa]|uniref:WAT1-related protein n=1 Tax=Cannabis sativa TaxID=3483 RepID=A0A7J6EE38_CANSA|nr:hypothetical protein F8388_006340 [Cannabis sativa]